MIVRGVALMSCPVKDFWNKHFSKVKINYDDINKLYKYMYKDATIFLQRKKEKFDIYINERK